MLLQKQSKKTLNQKKQKKSLIPLWFVFTLYSVSLIFYWLHQLSNKFVSRTMFITVMSIEGLLCGWLLNTHHFHLPLGIERDLTILFFFGCGWLCKEPIKKIHNSSSTGAVNSAKSTAIVAAVGIISFVAYGFLESPSPNFSIMNNDLGKSLFQFVASSITGKRSRSTLRKLTAIQLIRHLELFTF